uniref:Uncharacterized protein LOC111137312 isoform X2 n=1 Tax=Crassostrea virginica TaxID=6565 RepID=A0A8B8EWU4_CRAVI|nr:uncharacterized protein LOC111137312 isoform X2 [Crassostrea virginica]
MHMSFALLWLTYNFFREASVNADKKCWKIKEMHSRTDGFIRCQKSMIFIEEVKLERRYYRQNWRKIDCPVFLYPDVKNLFKYNGLFDLDVEIFSTLEKYANNCNVHVRNSRKTKVCIVFDCIHGQMNTLIQSPTVKEARGSLYQAVQLTGFLHCAIQGNISKITVPLSNSTTVSVRDKYGNEVLNSDDEKCECIVYFTSNFWANCHCPSSEPDLTKFTLTKNAINKNGVEVTIYAEVVSDVTIIVEGGKYYNCRNATDLDLLEISNKTENHTKYGMHGNYHNTTTVFEYTTKTQKQTEIGEVYNNCTNGTYGRGLNGNYQTENQSIIDSDISREVSVHRLPWILTSIFMTLSLVLTVVCVLLCLLQRKHKESRENEVPSDFLYNSGRESHFESPLYMENVL